MNHKNKRSFIGNLTYMVEGIADTIGNTTAMLGKFAEAGSELGEATLVLSKSNTKLVTLKSAGEEAQALKELKEEYGDDLFEVITE